ncbi:MAG: TOTE conflict system archaeo-eukaryotic primase domain-containing protein [Mycobacteriaceae bacterium]
MTEAYDNPLWKCVGRADVFAQQMPEGNYFPVRRPLTVDDVDEHLAGQWSIGTYVINPIAEKCYVNFVVFDLDTYEKTELDTLKECVMYAVDPLADPGAYECLLLESSGGKGHHVWLFFDQPIEAYRARAWLEASFWPRWNQRSETGRALEVFPKQDRISEGGFGNLVKLPLGVHARTGVRSEIVGCQDWAPGLESVRGMDTSDMPQYTASQPKVTDVITATTPTGVLTGTGPVARFLRGDVQQGERNSAFHAFFTWAAWNIHLPSDLAWEWWQRLNEELPDPESDEDEVRTTMESAYTRPPADAAEPRPTRRRPTDGGEHRRLPRDQRVAAMRAERG